jgi:hypothetical protein
VHTSEPPHSWLEKQASPERRASQRPELQSIAPQQFSCERQTPPAETQHESTLGEVDCVVHCSPPQQGEAPEPLVQVSSWS